jgi:hypothetical protein
MYKLGYTFFSAFGKEGKQKDWNPTSTSSGFLWKLFDLALAFGLIASMWVCMAKGLVSWIKDRHRRTFSKWKPPSRMKYDLKNRFICCTGRYIYSLQTFTIKMILFLSEIH